MLRFRYTLCIPLILFASACLAATKPQAPKSAPLAEAVPKVVRAQTFELTDAAGKTRAWLGTLEDGTTLLRLLDKDGKPKVIVDSNGVITVLGDDGKPRVTAGVLENDYGIGLFDSKGIIRADMRVDTDGAPSVAMRDSAGNVRGTLLNLDDDPMLVLGDGKDEGARVALQVTDSIPMLSLWDTAGKPRASYSLTEDGSPLLQMTNADEEVLAEISTSEQRPSLLLDCPGSKMSAFLGFTEDSHLSLMLLNAKEEAQVGLFLSSADPAIVLGHENGSPAVSLRIGEAGDSYVRTSDEDNITLWDSSDLGPP